VEMEQDGLIDKKTAVLRIDPNQLDQLLHRRLDPVAKEKATVLGKGLPASPGAAVGKVVFTADRAHELTQEGEKVLLVRTETSPEDIEGMHAAVGILTSRGGMTSHAAVVARGMGKPCVAGCSDAIIDEDAKVCKVGGEEIHELDWLTLDGTSGEVIQGEIPTIEPEVSGNFAKLMKWADEFRKLKVKTNADTPHDAQVARDFGAEGIGLCRTEHMFFEGERIKAVREMILAESLAGRKKALAKIEPMQKEDFKGLFKVMSGLPVIIRLLDPPLHEFLPKEEEDIRDMAKEMKVDAKKIKDIISNLHEFNPMLGFRGCRLGIKYPEISEMQARAILTAAIESKKEGVKPMPWIEVPLVGNVREYLIIKEIIDRVATELKAARGKDYWVGTMIEVPRAALTADEIAPECDFMSFGTNDLTQMTCGFSRDDAGSFLKPYVEQGIYERDPFQSIDQTGVGKIMELCIGKAKEANPKIEIGICGEHGGEPESVKFCHRIGLNDVSCSPFRVPIARLAAAQAALEK
jgi:pyruvate,orthophosphate dikinase